MVRCESKSKVLGGELGGSTVTEGETDGGNIGPVERGLWRAGEWSSAGVESFNPGSLRLN